VVFGLDDGNRLFFDDARKFGYVRALSDSDLATWDFWRSLGPEPLEIAAPGFAELFRGRRGRIKALLLDQTVIAGIGNIYADESLFRASIRPDAQAGELSPDRLRVLHGHLVDVLRESIAECGSSIRDYRDAHGDAGAFQNRFRVYGRSGQPCVACGRTLATGKVAGRTTVYCERCQKPK
jgi:formamidopyrimidine-DNA glycosylase